MSRLDRRHYGLQVSARQATLCGLRIPTQLSQMQPTLRTNTPLWKNYTINLKAVQPNARNGHGPFRDPIPIPIDFLSAPLGSTAIPFHFVIHTQTPKCPRYRSRKLMIALNIRSGFNPHEAARL